MNSQEAFSSGRALAEAAGQVTSWRAPLRTS
jgi:hypothetical protein